MDVAYIKPKVNLFENIRGDFMGGIAAMLVSLPSTIAYGLMSFAPLIAYNVAYASMAAIGAIIGTVAFSIISPLFGGTKGLVSSPSAAAAAVLSVFVAELAKKGSIPIDVIPVYVTLLTLFAGLMQIIIGNFGGGKFIKYIPFPVISGYLSGVSVLIIMGQIPKLLGLPKEIKLANGILQFNLWNWQFICIGVVSMVSMYLSIKYVKKIPSAIIALSAGIATYWLIALFNPALAHIQNNHLIIGELSSSTSDIFGIIYHRWTLFSQINLDSLIVILVPGITLSLLLSINSLNTCIVLDAKTHTNHNPKKELIVQGIGNISSALVCGIPGGGVMTATLENLRNGGKTRKSVIFVGINTLIVLLLLGKFLAWLPIPALAGILIVVAFRLIDFKVLAMLKNKSTILDFIVIIAVVVAAANLDLIKASGVGIAMAIFLFLREQMGVTVIRRKIFGNQLFSKKIRLNNERKVLEDKGRQTIIIELQGQLFFGTTDQLFSKLEPYYANCTYVVLDMRRVQSVDYTAANMLKKILARITELNGYLIFCSIPDKLPTGQNLKKYLKDFGLNESNNLKLFDDLDATLVWIEDKILIEEKVNIFDNNKILDLPEIEFFFGFNSNLLMSLNECLEEKSYTTGQVIFKTGDKCDEVYFVRKGNVKIVLPIGGSKSYHLLTIGMGGIFGEMAFIDNVMRSADALSVDETELYVLSREKFNQTTLLHPELAGVFFERLALLIANRLRQSNKELKVFQEN